MNDFIEAHGNSLQQTIAKWFTLTEKVNVLGLKHTIDVFFSLNFIELQKRKEFGKEQKQTGGRTNKRKNVLTMGEWKERTDKRREDERMDRQTKMEQRDGRIIERTEERTDGQMV